MHTTSSYGEYYTKVFYISLCLNGSVWHSNILFSFQRKGSQSNDEELPFISNNTAKIGTIFEIANFFSFFFFPLSDNPAGKMLAL